MTHVNDIQQAIARLSPARRQLLERRLAEMRAQTPGEDLRHLVPAEPQEQLILTGAQKRLHAFQALHQDSFAYNMPLAFRILGPLSMSQVRHAVTELISRHDALRARFEVLPVGVRQHFTRDASFECSVERWLPNAEPRDEWCNARLAEVAKRPFDLVTGPLVRVAVLCLDELDKVVCLVFHHIVSDGSSLGILAQDFFRALDGDTELPKPDVAFSQYIRWSAANGRRTDSQREFWQQQVAGLGRLCSAPSWTPAGGAFRRVFRIEPGRLAALRAAFPAGMGSFGALQVVVAACVAAATGAGGAVITSPVSGRVHPQLSGVVGYLADMLPFCFEFSPAASLATLTKVVGEQRRRVLAAQDVSFDEISAITEQLLQRSASLAEVVFSFHEFRLAECQVGGLEVRPVEVPIASGKFPLLIACSQDERGGLSFVLESNGQLSVAALEEFADALRRLAARFDETSLTQVRARLRDQAWGRLALPATSPAPVSAAVGAANAQCVAAVCAVFRKVLGVESLAVDANLFEYGLDSMSAIRACAAAKRVGIEFSPGDLLTAGTVAGVAQRARLTSVADDATTTSPSEAHPMFTLLSAQDEEALRVHAAERGVVAAFPVSDVQAGVLYHQAKDKEGRCYYDVFQFQLPEVLDASVFERCWQWLAMRHEMLRVRFDVSTYSEPLQLIEKAPTCEFAQQKVPESGAAAEDWCVEAHRTAPDAEDRGLLRVRALCDERETRLCIAFHHVLLDGWSLASLMREFITGYRLCKAGQSLPELSSPPSYARYLEAERRSLSDPSHAVFWREHLGGVQPCPVLAERSGADQDRRLRTSRVLARRLAHRFAAVSRDLRVPLRTLCLALHSSMLACLSLRRDVVFLAAVNARPDCQGSDQMLGLLLNMSPMRLGVADGSWRELVALCLAEETKLLAYRQTPLRALRKYLSPAKIETAFNFTNLATGFDDGGGGDPSTMRDQLRLESERSQVSFPLLATFQVHGGEGDLALHLDALGSMLSERALELVADRYCAAIEHCCENPHGAWYDAYCEPARSAATTTGLFSRAKSRVLAGLPWRAAERAAGVLVDTEGGPRSYGPVEVHRLPASELVRAAACPADQVDAGDLDERLVAIWESTLGSSRPAADADFFDSGGDSVTAMRLLARVRRTMQLDVPFEDLYAARTLGAFDLRLRQLGRARSTPGAPVLPQSTTVPASFQQKRHFWFQERWPDNTMFSGVFAVRLRGEVEPELLVAASRLVIQQHRVLRTRLRIQDARVNEPLMQEVVPFENISIEVQRFETHGCPCAPENADTVAEILAQVADQPFRLSEPAPPRLVLVLPSDHGVGPVHSCVFAWVLHHSVYDGTSAGIYWSELARNYERLRGAKELVVVPSCDEQYERYAQAQSRAKGGQGWSRAFEFWNKALAGAPRNLESPLFELRPQIKDFTGGHVEMVLPVELTSGVEGLGRVQGCTPFAIYAAAFALVLRHYTLSDDVMFGTLFANRLASPTQCGGMRLNQAPLRATFGSGVSVADFLRSHAALLARSSSYQDFPVQEELLAAWKWSRDPAFVDPLLHAVVVMQNMETQHLPIGDSTVEWISKEGSTSEEDLMLFLVDAGQAGVRGVMEYSARLMTPQVASTIIALLQTALERFVESPERDIDTCFSSGPASPQPCRPRSAAAGEWHTDIKGWVEAIAKTLALECRWESSGPERRGLRAKVRGTASARIRWRDHDLVDGCPGELYLLQGTTAYDTGWLGCMREDGLWLLGRKAQFGYQDGYRLNLFAIERALLEGGCGVDRVQAAWTAPSGSPYELRIHVSNADGGVDALGQWLGERLPRYALPGRVLVRDQNGNSFDLDLLRMGRSCTGTLASVSRSAEQRARWAWETVLGHVPQNAAEDFFAVGGSSWLALRLVTLVAGPDTADAADRAALLETLYRQPSFENFARGVARLAQHCEIGA